MSASVQYTTGPVSAELFCQLWSARADALERHLSANTWALGAATAVLIAYPIARIVIRAIVNDIAAHVIVPDMIRTVLKLV